MVITLMINVISYYQDNTKHSETEYKNNLKHGKYILYNYNGKILQHGYYKNDLEDGYWSIFSPKTFQIEQFIYKKGKKDGEYSIFYDMYKIKEKGSYYNDAKYGNFQKYNYNGQLIEEGQYHNDQLVNKYIEYDSYGEISISITYVANKSNYFRKDYIRYNFIPEKFYLISNDYSGKRISKKAYDYITEYDSYKYLDLQNNIILFILPFAALSFLMMVIFSLIIYYKFKKNSYKEKNLFLTNKLDFDIFETINNLDISNISIVNNIHTQDLAVKNADIQFFKINTINFINSQIIKKIFQSESEYSEANEYIRNKIHNNNIKDVIDYCESNNQLYIKKYIIYLLILFLVSFGVIYYGIVIGYVFGIALSFFIIFSGIILLVLLIFFYIRTSKIILTANSIKYFIMQEILKFCQLKISHKEIITDVNGKNFTGKIIISYNLETCQKELNYNNGVLHNRQIYTEGNVIVFETLYHLGKNIGPFIKYEHGNNPLYKIISKKNKFILDIVGNKYNKNVLEELTHNFREENFISTKKAYLSKDKTDIFKNLMNKLFVNPVPKFDLEKIQNVSIKFRLFITIITIFLMSIALVSFESVFSHNMPIS